VPKLNAVDAISPAFKLTTANLFQPFRWGFWLRIAVLGFLTGEMSTGGGCNVHLPSGWNTHGHDHYYFNTAPFPFDLQVLWAILPVLIGVFLLLGLVFTYIASVCHFMLLEAVLNGQISLREGWSRWQSQGIRYFVFRLLLGLAILFVIGMVVLLVLAMVGISSFQHGSGLSAGAIAGIFLGILLIFILMLPFLLVHMLAKDFAVPVMALGGGTFGEAWRRVWNMVRDEFGSVAGYIGMKIILAIGASVIFGIIIFIVTLVVLLPIGGLGLLTVFAGKAAGMSWTPATITLLVGLAVILLALIMFVISFVSSPVSVFFPSYALYFFAGRYQPLHDRLFPPPPPAPQPPPSPPIIEPPPEPLAT
jgi:hypothetical protein